MFGFQRKVISLIIVWKYFVLLPGNISYYRSKNISSAWDFNDQSSMKCAKSNRRCWELAAIKIKYNKNVQFWAQLEKNRWIKKSQCAKWQSPISDRKREFFSINLLTVIVLGSEERGAWTRPHIRKLHSPSSRPGDKPRSLESFLHPTPDTLPPSLTSAFFWHWCWSWRRWGRQKPSLDTFPLDGWKY